VFCAAWKKIAVVMMEVIAAATRATLKVGQWIQWRDCI
jgi:hypothetical protein